MTPLETLANVPPGIWVLESQYLYYGALAGHAIGMGLVVGVIYTLTLRVFGFSRALPLSTFDTLFPIARNGFILNALTGLLLFTANGASLIKNGPFLIKIACVLVAGILSVLAARAVRRAALDEAAQYVFPTSVKITVAAAAVVWTAAIVAGRIIAYTIEY